MAPSVVHPRRVYETASVLFIDIVSYSTETIDRQTESLTILQDIVRAANEFQRARRDDELIVLPAGDGMALVFMRDLLSSVRCAVEIADMLQFRTELKIRMGVHIGPVCRHSDIKEQINVVGGGINIAQRVMDCGDAGHILLSGNAAEILLQLDDWRNHLRDLGMQTVKHGVEIRLYSICREGLGNPELPRRIRPQVQIDRPGQYASVQERALDVAIAKQVPVLEPTELVAMIRQLTSQGLRGVLDSDPDFGVSPDDVRSKPLTLEFPVDQQGRASPAQIVLRIDSPDFVPASQSKTIRVSPIGDSEPFTFLLTPMQLGELRINVELYTLGINLLSRVLRTRVTNSDRMPVLVPHTVLTIPLVAVVAKTLPRTGLLDGIVEEGRLGPAASKPEAEFENLQARNKVEFDSVRKPSNRPDTGEFTLLFQDPQQKAEPDLVPPPAVPASPPDRQQGGSSYAPPPPASLSSSAPDATRLFSVRDNTPSSTTTAQETGSFHSGEVLRGSDAGNQSLLGDVYIQDKSTDSGGGSAEKTVWEPQPIPERAEPAKPPVPNPVKRSFPANRVQLIALAVACYLTVLVVGIAAAVYFLRTPKYQPLPGIGTAVVTSDSVPLFAGPSTAEKHLAVLRKGSKVNILRMPKFPNPEWMEVQQVGDIAGAPGYVSASALGGWSTFGLMQLFDPGDFSDLPQRIKYLEALRANIAGFGNADQDQAWLEIARQDIAIARDKKASSVAPDNWQNNVGEARDALAKVSSHQSMAEPSKKMQQEIAGILEPPPEAAPRATTTLPSVIRKSDPAADYRAAEDAFRNGQYAKATQLLKHILNVDSQNAGAKSLLEKVEKAAAQEITPHQ